MTEKYKKYFTVLLHMKNVIFFNRAKEIKGTTVEALVDDILNTIIPDIFDKLPKLLALLIMT